MRQSSSAVQGNLFKAEGSATFSPSLPAGFSYAEDVIPAADEQTLLAHFDSLPFKPFEFHGFLGKRQVVSFGWRYDFAGQALQESAAIPAFLMPLRRKVAEVAGISAGSLEQVLVNKYEANAGIGWHRDKPMFQDVVVVSLGGPCLLRLRRKEGNQWKRASQRVRARSVYILRDSVRREWEHSISPVEQLRYSVTFRNFVQGSHA